MYFASIAQHKKANKKWKYAHKRKEVQHGLKPDKRLKSYIKISLVNISDIFKVLNKEKHF